MNASEHPRSIRLIACVLLGAVSAPICAETPVAGLKPDARPEGAPTIEAVDNGANWYRQALTGITGPYPRSLGFLESQGNWYTPFNHPGMTGLYDIRRWHRDDLPEQGQGRKGR